MTAFDGDMVPRQSAPVSPPPMMTTCFPVARISSVGIERIAVAALVLLRQEFHRVVDALQFPSRDYAGRAAAPRLQPARWRRTLAADPPPATFSPTCALVTNFTPSACHLLQAAVDEVLFHLEFGNAVAQQSADAVRLFVNRDPVAGAIKLLRGGQSRRARADDRNFSFRCGRRGGSGWIQPSLKARSTMFFSICLIVTGGSLIPSTQDASQGAGQMRPVNSGKLLVACNCADGFFPAAVIHQIVPVRNDVVDRASGVAERHAAIHAARALWAQFFFGKILIDLEPVVHPLRRPGGAAAVRACTP